MRLRSLVAVFAALLLVGSLAGCSKKDSGASEKSTTTTAESDKSDSEDSGSDSSGSDEDSLDAGDLGVALTGTECADALLLYGSMIGAAGTLMAGATDEQVDKLEGDIDKLKDSVPSDLQDDFQTVADAYKQFGEVFTGLSAADYLDPDVQEDLQKASEGLDSAEVKDASDNIEKYFEDGCK